MMMMLEKLGLLHSLTPNHIGCLQSFNTFTNDYSKLGYIYLMHRKSDALNKFIIFKVESDNLLGKHIKTLLFDWGCEFMTSRFEYFLRAQGIISQLSTLGTPLQNEEMEKRSLTLMDTLRSMISFSSLLTSFWGYALETMPYLIYLRGILACRISKRILGIIAFIVRMIKRCLLIPMLDFLWWLYVE